MTVISKLVRDRQLTAYAESILRSASCDTSVCLSRSWIVMKSQPRQKLILSRQKPYLFCRDVLKDTLSERFLSSLNLEGKTQAKKKHLIWSKPPLFTWRWKKSVPSALQCRRPLSKFSAVSLCSRKSFSIPVDLVLVLRLHPVSRKTVLFLHTLSTNTSVISNRAHAV